MAGRVEMATDPGERLEHGKSRKAAGPWGVAVDAALRAVTIEAAFQIGKEDVLGSISPGKHADLVVLDANPLTTDPGRIGDIKVKQTWLAGECVWSDDA